MKWQTGTPEAGRRILVKNIIGCDPFRIFEARAARTERGVELRLKDEARTLRGRDLHGVMHVALAN